MLANLLYQSTTAQPAQNRIATSRLGLDGLHTLSDEVFTVLTKPAFPEHSVRIKKSKICNEGAQYVIYHWNFYQVLTSKCRAHSAGTPATLIFLEENISSSTSLRADVTRRRTMLFYG
jgi:hypothetical protein